MEINGIRHLRTSDYTIFYIERFSDELKEIIRNQLRGVWNGFSSSEDLPEFYSYKNTLASFWDRFKDKAEDTKKGMIGELLSHIVLNHYEDDLTSLSILKNKEERSIKKGFDIIYCNLSNNQLWYSEVKSGASESNTASDYNHELLNRAKNGILEMLGQNQNSRWESALFDVSATIRENEGRINLQLLLSRDAPSENPNQTKNVILISVLFNDLSDQIELDRVKQYWETVSGENVFLEVMVISIQKKTYSAVADFLESEINNS